MSKIVIATLYKFVSLPDYVELREPILGTCVENEVKGSLLLAAEGLNGTIAGKREGVNKVLAYLRADARLAELEHQESLADEVPFRRMKVRLKKEIVTIGLDDIDPTEKVGTYVKPAAWNDLISEPDVMLIDTRNDYEIRAGTFEGAINPHTEAFGEFPDFVEQHLDPDKQQKIAMFCTGGIRCEKASSLLLNMGFKEVYHLKGGILNYLAEVPEQNSRWQGECFVFDERITVNHHLQPGNAHTCPACKHTLSVQDIEHPDYHFGVSCPYCTQCH
ncbi:MAG: rhodanese-related sulfurtransferase [Ardenticatenaceae bacterium]